VHLRYRFEFDDTGDDWAAIATSPFAQTFLEGGELLDPEPPVIEQKGTYGEIARLRESINNLRAEISSASDQASSEMSYGSRRSLSSRSLPDDTRTMSYRSFTEAQRGGDDDDEDEEELEDEDEWHKYLRERQLLSSVIPPSRPPRRKKKTTSMPAVARGGHDSADSGILAGPSWQQYGDAFDHHQSRDSLAARNSGRPTSAEQYREHQQRIQLQKARKRTSSGFIVGQRPGASGVRQSHISSSPDVRSSWTGRPFSDAIDYADVLPRSHSQPMLSSSPYDFEQQQPPPPQQPPIMSIEEFEIRHKEKLKRMQSPVTAQLESEAEAEKLKARLEREKKRLETMAKRKKQRESRNARRKSNAPPPHTPSAAALFGSDEQHAASSSSPPPARNSRVRQSSMPALGGNSRPVSGADARAQRHLSPAAAGRHSSRTSLPAGGSQPIPIPGAASPGGGGALAPGEESSPYESPGRHRSSELFTTPPSNPRASASKKPKSKPDDWLAY
jgi:hypothetical protein